MFAQAIDEFTASALAFMAEASGESPPGHIAEVQ